MYYKGYNAICELQYLMYIYIIRATENPKQNK